MRKLTLAEATEMIANEIEMCWTTDEEGAARLLTFLGFPATSGEDDELVLLFDEDNLDDKGRAVACRMQGVAYLTPGGTNDDDEH